MQQREGGAVEGHQLAKLLHGGGGDVAQVQAGAGGAGDVVEELVLAAPHAQVLDEVGVVDGQSRDPAHGRGRIDLLLREGTWPPFLRELEHTDHPLLGDQRHEERGGLTELLHERPLAGQEDGVVDALDDHGLPGVHGLLDCRPVCKRELASLP